MKMNDKIKSLSRKLKETMESAMQVGEPGKSISVAKQNEYFNEMPFSSLLPYEVYDDVTGLFHNIDTFGILIESAPFAGPCGEVEFTNFLKDKLPVGACLQVLLVASPDIMPQLEAFKQLRSRRGDIFNTLAQKRFEFLKAGAKESLLASEDFLVRDFKLYYSVTLDKEHGEKKILAVKAALLALLDSMGMPAQILNPSHLIRLTHLLVNPYAFDSDAVPEYNPRDRIGPQTLSPGTSLLVNEEDLCMNEGQSVSRTYRITQYPEHSSQMHMQELIGDMMRPTLRIGAPFVMSMIVYAGNHDYEKSRYQMLNINAERKANSPIARFIPNLRVVAQDLNYLMSQFEDGDKIIKTCFQCTVYGKEDILDKHANSLESLLQAKKYKFSSCRYIQLSAFLSTLPMMVNDAWVGDASRFNMFKTQLTNTIPSLLPLQGEAKGVQNPLLPIIGRRGQIAFVDPFENTSGNYNTVTVGASGSGKSAFNIEKLMAHVGSGGRAFVIDVGRSYLKLAQLLKPIGAEFIEFTGKESISLNPFSRLEPPKESSQDEQENFEDGIALIKRVVAQMASPSAPLDDFRLSVIEEAIMGVYRQHGKGATITHVSQMLKDHPEPRIKDIGQMLYPYTKDGNYGKYFEGPCHLSDNAPLIVFELEELKSKKDLQSVVLMLLMYQVTRSMYFNRLERTTCLIDEAWDLLSNVQGAEFIETGCRRARKYNGGFDICTQSVEDFEKSPATRAAFDNSDTVFLLRQKESAINWLLRSGKFTTTPQEQETMRSITTKHGEYAEMAVLSPESFLMGRLIYDPFAIEIVSSKGEEFAQVMKMMDAGVPIVEALTHMMEKKQHVEAA